MAYPAQLVTSLADALDVPAKTVAQHDRLLAVSGHRSTGGRGRSAARVTANDAANLIIAVVGAPVSGPAIKDSAANFERYASLPASTKILNGRLTKWPPELKILQDLVKGHTLRDALAALITTFANQNLVPSDIFSRADGQGSEVTDVLLRIELHGPKPEASITISGSVFHSPPLNVDENTERLFSTPHRYTLFYSHSRLGERDKSESQGDLHQIRIITEVTVKAIAQLFCDEQRANDAS